MEHFGGTKYCFGNHLKARAVEFTLADKDPSKGVSLVLDGDHKPCGRSVVIENLDAAWRVYAPKAFPTSVDPSKLAPKPLTPASDKWLKMYPVPSDLAVLPPKQEEPPASSSAVSRNRLLAALALAVLVVAFRNWKARR
jgi:hypothetical protein